MLIKVGVDGVDLSWFTPEMWEIVKAVSKAWSPEEVVITATTEGTHVDWSRHYRKAAVDFRPPKLDRAEKLDKVRKTLGPDYLVLDEENHIHVQYNKTGV